MQQLINVFSNPDHRLKLQNESDMCPIFIVGMPRSGSTLTESIISAHSQVTAAGERQELIHATRKIDYHVMCRHQYGS